MKIYLVGGAVRDQLLGCKVASDKDYLVTGATTEDMLKAGFIQVGKAFPVFIDPKTQEEYALARVEEKTGPGYKGFRADANPFVTVEEDLARRDLTMNAIAFDGQNYIDPYGGMSDLQHKILRPIGNNFEHDPVRVLRLARFKARFPDFSFHESLYPQIHTLHEMGELETLDTQRVRQEMEKAFACTSPSLFFETLSEFQIIHTIFPEMKPIVDDFIALDKLSYDPAKKHIYYAVLLAISMDHHTKRAAFLKRFGICQHKAFILELALLHDNRFQFPETQDFVWFIRAMQLNHDKHHVMDDVYSAMCVLCDKGQADRFYELLKHGVEIMASMDIKSMLEVHQPVDKRAFIQDMYIQALRNILTQFQGG
ncbi:MAG: hypothetical protein Q8K36_03190 [Alphaproteobacteria bacterium]|nr:hypothetical protein [Alphaproteobacteria bacterium]